MLRKTLSYVLVSLIVIAAAFSWRSVDRAIFAEGASDFWVPIIWFSVFATLLGLAVVLVRERVMLWIFLAISLLLSFIFIRNIFHLVPLALSSVFIFAAQKSIEEDIESSVRIHLAKSLHRGIFLIVIAFAMMISSQYFFSIRTLDSEKLTPNVSKGGLVGNVINLVLPRISPEFRQVKSEEITVDQFLGKIYESSVKRRSEKIDEEMKASGDRGLESDMKSTLESELGRRLTADESKQLESFENKTSLELSALAPELKKDFLEEWKKGLSEAANFRISGDEKIEDVFVTIINSKLDELAQPVQGRRGSGMLPVIFTLILFLTLVSLGSFAARVWVMLTAGVFWILKKTGIVKIETVTREAEVIA